MKTKAANPPTMIEEFRKISGHSMGGHETTGASGGGDSIAAETTYYFAVCNECSFRGEETTLARIAHEEARQHMADFPGHSVFVENKAAPLS